MSSIPDYSNIVFNGKKNVGKSFLVRDYLYHHSDIPVGLVISATEHANHFYSQIVPKMFIHYEYQPEIVANFMKRQKKMVKKIENGETNIDKRAFIILDDCFYDSEWSKNKHIREILMNGRHYGINFLETAQFPLCLPPVLRTNIDYVFILRENITSNRKRLYENFAGMFPTFDMFCSVMDQCTENFECLVINNTVKSNKIEDQVFWYKAEDHPPFRLCSDELWRISDEQYKYDDDEDEGININTYSKKNRTKLNVKKITV